MNRFLLGVEEFNLIDSFKSPMKDNFMHQFFMVVVGYLFFDNLLFKVTPFKKVSPATANTLIVIQAAIVIACLQSMTSDLIPKPLEILQTLVAMVQTREFYEDMVTSLLLTI